jgi:hypothetical protein
MMGCVKKMNIFNLDLEPIDFVVVAPSGTLQHPLNNDRTCPLREGLGLQVCSVMARRGKDSVDGQATFFLGWSSPLASVDVKISFREIDGRKIGTITDTQIGKLMWICV